MTYEHGIHLRRKNTEGGAFCIFVFCLLGPCPQCMEIPRLVVQLELQPPAYTTAIATWEPSHVCDLHHSSQQHEILNPLNKARDRTLILMDTGQACKPLSHNGNSLMEQP